MGAALDLELQSKGADRQAQLVAMSRLLGWTLSVEGNVALLDGALADADGEVPRACHELAQQVLGSLGACWRQLLRSELLAGDSMHADHRQREHIHGMLRRLHASLQLMQRPYAFEYEPTLRSASEMPDAAEAPDGKRQRAVF